MKLVIDIPEEIYQHYKKVWQKRRGSIPESCIAFGTPLPQEPSRDMEEIKKVINCDADVETKCKMISNILTAKPHYFEEPFINKSCISEKVCEHDKNAILDKIRAEIEQNAYPIVHGVNNHEKGMTLYGVLQIIDKYKSESEGNNDRE